MCCRCLGLPAALLIFVTQAFFLAAMDPWTPLAATGLAGIVNLGGDIALVCCLNQGIAGAAFATAVAQARPCSLPWPYCVQCWWPAAASCHFYIDIPIQDSPFARSSSALVPVPYTSAKSTLLDVLHKRCKAPATYVLAISPGRSV